ncbi:alpha/beta fold hydrolase [Euzebya tangerina]|uniref:alpha/beta fold hydrolase n=1 Tax=Euzebya tangerina TaxID=591198 RepID=UPI0013C345AB|nr:alpha/beta hydrolase [Euzebya tangerina]
MSRARVEGVSRGYVETSWGQVHIRRAGQAGPAIVLLHESPLSSATYAAVLPALARGARAVAIDTPGYGMSDGPPARAEISEYASVLLEVTRTMGLDRIAVVGVHTGASLAVQMAVQAPDRVTHLVLSGVPLITEEQRAEYLRSWAPEVPIAPDGSHLAWAWERYERIWSGPPDLLHLGATTLLANLQDYHLAYNAAFRYDPRPDLANVRCPVLLYTAEDDLLITSDEEAVVLFPDAQLERVPGLVGQLPLRIPTEFAARVLRFVSAAASR